MADFDKPNLQTELTSNFEDIRENVNATSKMLKGVDVNGANLPIDAVKFEGNTFYRWNGLSYDKDLIGIGGGGTGAETDDQARINLGADNASNLTKGTLPSGRLSGSYNIDIDGNAATADNADLLEGNNAAFYRNASNLNAGTVPDARLPIASTSDNGIVQLNNTVTSTSTTQAATANAVKNAYDKGAEGLSRASTQVGGGSVSGVYYNEFSITNNDVNLFYTMKVVRVGDMVTLGFTEISASSAGKSISPLPLSLPSWATPTTSKDNVYYFVGTSPAGEGNVKIIVFPNGKIGLSSTIDRTFWRSPSITYVIGV